MGRLDIGRMMQGTRISGQAEKPKNVEGSKEDFKKLLEEQKEQDIAAETDSGRESAVESKCEETSSEQDTNQKGNTEQKGESTFYQLSPLLQNLFYGQDQIMTVQADGTELVSQTEQGKEALLTIQGQPELAAGAKVSDGTQAPENTEIQQPAMTEAQTSENIQKVNGLVEQNAQKLSAGAEKKIVAQPEQKEETSATVVKNVSGETKAVAHERKQADSHAEEINTQIQQKIGSAQKNQPEEKAETEQPEAVSLLSNVTGRTNSVEAGRKNEHIQGTQIHVTKPEEIPQKLLDELLIKTSQGRKEFEIQITPENLGRISVKVLYENGQTTVSILCSEKTTQEMVAKNAREIGAVMEQNLGAPTTVMVEKQETDYLEQQTNENAHAGRDAEQERQREEQQKQKAADAEQFLQKLRLGLQSAF
ncbi:MAG: flagellar hook-length control protein FliK [Lachnospiraceae bacterium]|nr:flagellar hook-length control protein FliK [Lachnospiraceae bacterium]